ncbi:MAG: GtrA family protein [Bacteroidales bacterium]|nr:GtrA family protein [Bacteroidales bacterium]
MRIQHRNKFVELLMRFAIFSITSGAGTLVDLGGHWWLSSQFMTDKYWWTFWLSPIISFEAAVITNFAIAYFWVWRERISKRSTRSFFRHYAGYNAAATGVFLIKLLIMQGIHLLLAAFGWFQTKSYEPALCNMLALCFSGFFSFALNEFVVFRKIEKKTGEPLDGTPDDLSDNQSV